MKYRVSFGDSDMGAVVDAPKDDETAIIVEAARQDLVFVHDREMVESMFRNHPLVRDPDWNVFRFANAMGMEYIEELGGFVDVRYLEWYPVPPNVKVGPFDIMEEPTRNRFRGDKR